MIHKNGEDLNNERFCYYYQCIRDYNHAIHNVKRRKKRQTDSKDIENEALYPKELRFAMKTINSN